MQCWREGGKDLPLLLFFLFFFFKTLPLLLLLLFNFSFFSHPCSSTWSSSVRDQIQVTVMTYATAACGNGGSFNPLSLSKDWICILTHRDTADLIVLQQELPSPAPLFRGPAGQSQPAPVHQALRLQSRTNGLCPRSAHLQGTCLEGAAT